MEQTMTTLNDLIGRAVEQQIALREEKQRRENEERKRFVATQIARLRDELEDKLTPEVRDVLDISYSYGQVHGYSREGFEHAYACLSVHDAALTLVDDVSGGYDSPIAHRWVLITPEYARLSIKAFDAETAQRNLLLAIHDWQTGDHLHED